MVAFVAGELKVLPVSWYDELARILTKVEDIGVWPEGLLDAYIAMIPKTDGDAAPLGLHNQVLAFRYCKETKAFLKG